MRGLRKKIKKISIHAPTRGATYLELANEILGVFQSTLPREERPCALFCTFRQCSYFNPRSHERSDTTSMFVCSMKAISIHAPTRGATASVFDALRPYIFQSTLPREERRRVADIKEKIENFNPRSHERSDTGRHDPTDICCIFQSTLPREERLLQHYRFTR